MAKKRLNKKVAIVGSFVFILFVLAIIVAIPHLGRDPDKFIKDGDAAWLAKDYQRAQRNYLKAHRFAKTSSLRKEILFKLVDVYTETEQWPQVQSCWEQIINIDPKNIEVRFGKLKYFYIIADNYASAGRKASGVWEEVRSQTSELIEVVSDANLITADRAQWEPSLGVEQRQSQRVTSQLIGAYLYLLRGRAAYELAKMGAVTNPDELLDQALADLEKVQELDPNDIDAYYYLAQVAIVKGEILASRGNLEEKNKAAKQADELLQQAVRSANNDPRAYINVLTRKLELARTSDPKLIKQRIQALEPKYLSLVNKFPSSAEALATLSKFYAVLSLYSDRQQSAANLDKAITAAEKAIELDKDNVDYAITTASLYYRKSSVFGQKSEIQKAIAIAKKAVELPNAQDTVGPQSFANKMNRFLLFSFLANCYIEQIIEPLDKLNQSQIDVLLTNAEQAVHEIEQIFGSVEEPQIIKWQGMLELAQGNTNSAVRKLYTAYEQIKASNRPEQRDAQLCYTLAKIFQDTSELGAMIEFLASALEAGIDLIEPEAILDYLEAIGKLDMWSHVLSPVNPYGIDAYEQKFGANQRSQTLRIKALIGTNQISEAEEELAKLDQNEIDTIKLNLVLIQAKIRQIRTAIVKNQAKTDVPIALEQPEGHEQQVPATDAAVKFMISELNSYRQIQTELVQKLLVLEPNSVEEDSISAICGSFIAQGQIDKARDFVNRFMKQFPDNTAFLFYKQLLSEPDPTNVSEQRQKEVEKQTLINIADPLNRAVSIGIFYRRENEPNKAVEKLSEALQMKIPQGDEADKLLIKPTDKTNLKQLAANHLFNIAQETNDLKLAEQVVEIVQRENLDDCQGLFFAARLEVSKNKFDDALAKTNECLIQKPIFSYGYMLRSNIHAYLGNERASIEDINKAASLNPLDGTIAKSMAAILYIRNKKLGDNVSSEQITETRHALERAIRLNPGDLALLSDYAEYISTTEPSRALVIRQTLLKNNPTLENAALLARLAIKMALNVTDSESKMALFEIAHDSLEQAKKIDPSNKVILESYAEYYRVTGQEEKAKQLLLESQDDNLLWRHYFQLGQFNNAKTVLLRLYKQRSNDVDIIKGLLIAAEKTGDEEAIKRYSEELLALNDNAENRLEQIRAYLSVGLTGQAKHKLQSFKERFPNDSRILLPEGWLAMRQGQLKKALELTNQNLAVNEANAGAWRLRGEINLLMTNYEQATIDLKKSKSLLDIPATRIALAKAYLQAEREDDAITELKNTIDESTAPAEARILLEQIYLKLDRKQELRRFYDETLEKYPANVLWHNRAAAFALSTGEFAKAEQLFKTAYTLKQQAYVEQDTEKAIKDVQYATAFDGYLQTLIKAAGNSSATNGTWHPEKLNQVFVEGQKHEHTALAPLAFYRMGEAKLKLGDRKTAIEYCRKAVDKARTDENLVDEILHRMIFSLGADETSKYCEQRLKANPDSMAANFTMFNLLKIKGDYNKAIDYIDRCIELIGPDTPGEIDYKAKRAEFLTFAYERTSDNSYLTKAIADYESLLAKQPNNINILNNLAYMLAENNQRLSEALKYAERAVEKMPNNPYFMDTYAYVLYKNGQSSKAAELLTAALQQYRQDAIDAPAEVWEHLGMVKEKLGEKAQAIAAYKRALQVGIDKLTQVVNDRIKSAIERLSSQ